jgi:formylglycine-generating enzyme required for sulfatase activity
MQGFISYAHDDHAAFNALRQQFRALEQAFTSPITLWADDGLHAGVDWEATIKPQIDTAELFILLLSPAFLASDYVLQREIPAIRTRARGTKVLVIPVILTRCGWPPLVGRLQAVPMQNRRLLPVDEWQPPAHGFNEVRVQIERAVREHFHLTLRETNWFTPLLEQRQDPAGPILIQRNDQFDLDPSGSEADLDATADPVVRQLYPPNHDKAAELAALVARRANALGPEWDGLTPAATSLAEMLDQPLDRLPAQIATLWERSVRVASLLLQDKRLLEKPEADKAPLEADIHTKLDDLVGSLAPWVRSFPTARMLDDQRGEFLRTKALFEPARRVIEQAAADAVVTPTVEATIRGNIATAERGDAQAEKAGFYAIRGVRNALVSAAGYAAGFLAGATASGYASHSPLIDNVGRWLTGVEHGITTLMQDFPADMRLAIEHLTEVLQARQGNEAEDNLLTPDLVESPSAVSGIASEIAQDSAFWRDGQAPGWANEWGTDQYGPGVIFSVGDAERRRVSQRMRWIPSGHFMMGSPITESGRVNDEGPQHKVTITTGFWLFDTPCTQALWQTVIGDNPSRFRSPTRPVECVSFDDVDAFIMRLNGRLPGLGLQLPSEAQWEYACRAGTTTATYAGDLKIFSDHNAPVLDEIAWYSGNCGVGFELTNGEDSSTWKGKQYPHTHAGTRPVALKAPNAWGLYDMLGNVWEWCVDHWHTDYRGAPANGTAWVDYEPDSENSVDYAVRLRYQDFDPERATRYVGARRAIRAKVSKTRARVTRGGAWRDVVLHVRAARRGEGNPSESNFRHGFRCAIVPNKSAVPAANDTQEGASH